MESASGGPPSPPVMPPPVFAAPVAPSLYRQAFRIVKGNRKAMLLPLFVTEFPVSILVAIATFILYQEIYPEAGLSSVELVQENPGSLNLSIIMLNGILGLFTLIGLAATIVSANAIIAQKPIGLANSLDPAFTRMGGLLGLGLVYAGMVVTTLFLPFALFFLIRFGLALPAFVLDGQPLGQSLRTSWTVLRRRMLKFTALLLAFIGIAVVVMAVAILLLSIVIAPFVGTEASRNDEVLMVTAATLLTGIVTVPLGAFIVTTMTLFYMREKKAASNA